MCVVNQSTICLQLILLPQDYLQMDEESYKIQSKGPGFGDIIPA